MIPIPTQQPAHGQAHTPVYFWKQCYEIGDDVHWALCDSESQEQGKVSSAYMVLHANYKTAIDGKTVGDQFMPAKIIETLNGYHVLLASEARLKARIRELEELARHWSELAYHANVLACAKTKLERDRASLKVFSAIGNAKDDIPELLTAEEARRLLPNPPAHSTKRHE